MTGKKTTLYGLPLEMPVPAPLRVLALFDADKPCSHAHVPYSGKVPCTGVLVCTMCGTQWNPDTGKLIRKGVQ